MSAKSTTADAGVANASPVIEAIDLRKSYGEVRAVDGLSFSVSRGEILGLLGPNGAGKSTTLRMLIGFQYPDAGEVKLVGQNVYKTGHIARHDLGYLPESLPLYTEMDVYGYLRYFGQIKDVKSLPAAIERVVERLDLKAVLRRSCGNLSRGYRQRVGLAQALLSDPDVLILDEPTSGLDPNQIRDFRELIRGLGSERAILLSTHILPEALEVCDRVVILNKGRAVATGSPHDLAAGGSALHSGRIRTERTPSDAVVERFEMVPAGGATPHVWEVRHEMDDKEARDFLRLVVDEDWDLLEWHVGSAGLESVFRRLTLGEAT